MHKKITFDIYFNVVINNKQFYLLYIIIREPSPATAGSARINAKEREAGKTSEQSEEKEKGRGTKGETSHPGHVICS